MTEPVTPAPEAPRRKVSPFLIVAAIAVVAFIVALVAFRGGGTKSTGDVAAGVSQPAGCGAAAPDAAYSVAMTSEPDPPQVEGTTFHLAVRHGGRAVTGAKVCLTSDMSEMHHEGLNSVAKEAAGGTYDATLKFGMRGPYAGLVIITEPGHGPVSVPLNFQVG